MPGKHDLGLGPSRPPGRPIPTALFQKQVLITMCHTLASGESLDTDPSRGMLGKWLYSSVILAKVEEGETEARRHLNLLPDSLLGNTSRGPVCSKASFQPQAGEATGQGPKTEIQIRAEE